MQAPLQLGEGWKRTGDSSKYHSVQDLLLTFSNGYDAGKRLVSCDKKNISPELTKQNKNIGNRRVKEEAVHQEGQGRSKEHDFSTSLGN